MKTVEEIKEIIKNHRQTLEQKYKVKRIAIFGSYAKGEQTKDSDVDILVELERPLGLEFVNLAYYLEELLGKEVDLITFESFKEGAKNPRYKHIAEEIKGSLTYV